ncbi:MAG: hypothetical protein RIS70_3109 [Planctomycetota bacterium]
MALLELPQSAQGAVGLVLRLFTNTARVEQDGMRLFQLLRQPVPSLAQAGNHHFAVKDIHLTADGFDIEILHSLRRFLLFRFGFALLARQFFLSLFVGDLLL